MFIYLVYLLTSLQSVSYTAFPFFIIATIWFAIFGLCLLLICFCCRRQPYGYSRLAYALSLIFLVSFSIAAMYYPSHSLLHYIHDSCFFTAKTNAWSCIFSIGCVVLYTGQQKFHSTTINTLEYVVHQADDTSQNLRNVSGYLSAAKQFNVVQVSLPPNVQTDIDQIQSLIDSSATTLTSKTRDNSKDIKNLIESV